MALKLSFDVTTGNLVSWQGSSAALPPFGQCSTTIELRFVQPSATGSLPGAITYEAITLTGYLGPRIGIWSNSTFTLSDSDDYVLALAVHGDFTLNEDDADDPYYTGTFNTDTTEVAALGSDKTTAAYFAVGLVRTDLAIERVYDHRGATNCTIYSATDDGSGTVPGSATGGTRRIPLPLTVIDEATGEVYELTRTAAGTLTWVWTNP